MKAIEAKFPPILMIEWMRYLQDLLVERKRKVFPEFLRWLEKEGSVWAMMEARSSLTVSKSLSKPSSTFYSGAENRQAFRGTCFVCNEEGHRAADCPTLEPAGAGRRRGGGGRRGRPNQFRKFNCAFCRDNSLWCQTWNCTELRKMDYISRKSLLDANGDCKVCAGDCPASGCTRQTKRICGQGIEGCGCREQHVLNELFCP